MEGRPVWLASYSVKDPEGEIVATGDWTPEQLAEGEKQIRKALRRIGDENRERCFRMNVTLCVHRAASDEEIESLPRSWHEDLAGIAGGPVEVLWSRGCRESASSQPCENPGHKVLYSPRPDLWIPEDCGECPPCLARLELCKC